LILLHETAGSLTGEVSSGFLLPGFLIETFWVEFAASGSAGVGGGYEERPPVVARNPNATGSSQLQPVRDEGLRRSMGVARYQASLARYQLEQTVRGTRLFVAENIRQQY
jgi:hypothetical protein